MSRIGRRSAVVLGVAMAMLASRIVLGTTAASADAMVPRPSCPIAPHDGASCTDFDVGTACRYPRRGVVCACERTTIDGRRSRRWTCGELGE